MNKTDLILEMKALVQSRFHGYEEEIKRYTPFGKIQLLIIGESPPVSGAYFYKPYGNGKNMHHMSMPARIFRGLFSSSEVPSSEVPSSEVPPEEVHEHYLQKFSEQNYFLMDICAYPIDCFSSDVRSDLIQSSFADFIARLQRLDLADDCRIITVLPSGTVKNLKKYDVVQKIQESTNLQQVESVSWTDLEQWAEDFSIYK